MTFRPLTASELALLQAALGERLQFGVPLQRYTAARLGGPAQALFEAVSAAELAKIGRLAWKHDLPWTVLGGGSNVLVSDRGVPGLVVINQARRVRFFARAEPPRVWAESGANLGLVARQAAARGLAGLEWAAGIPGTIGGAVYGNAGAHGGDMAGNLLMADILQHVKTTNRMGKVSREKWPVERLEFSYRSSALKRQPGRVLVLAAELKLAHQPPAEIQARMDELVAYRRRTQPPGASMGSMFKNPPGDYAGRLIEAAGLKGTRQGGAKISELHANFFINEGQASAADVFALIRLAQEKVAERFGVRLELEIELVGEWDA